MKFTLLFYTDGWESGPTVELSHIPAPGSIVWTGGRRRDEEDSMYYVDNVMYPERGMDREDTVYLYVRPYTGYTRYAPMTEADRIVERLTAVGEELARVGEKLDALLADSGALRETAAALRDSVAALGGEPRRAVASRRAGTSVGRCHGGRAATAYRKAGRHRTRPRADEGAVVTLSAAGHRVSWPEA